MKTLSGPVIEPVSKQTRRAVLLLHGYGSSGEDLISLASSWRSYLPDTLFMAPNAPEPWEMSPQQGHQWFSLPDLSSETLSEGIEAALPFLHGALDQVLEHYLLTEDQVALVGFSQGAMMALAAGLSRARPLAAIVAYSGVLAYLETKPVYARPPVLLVHGDKDDVVPVSCLETSENQLKKRGVPVSALICQNIGHGIDPHGLQAGGAFLRRHLVSSCDTTVS